MFEQVEFTKACEELDSPDVVGWELFTESNNVKIYRLYNDVTGLYSYKIHGEMNAVKPEICVQVYMDIDYRKEWDSYVKELREIKEEGKEGVYWQVKLPFPLYNRDYTFQREKRELEIEGRHIYVILSKVDDFPSVPPVSGVVRVSEFVMSLAITSDGKVGSKAFLRYYDNPGGMIPTWFINWAAKTGVPSFLTTMEKACEGYEKYLQKKCTK